MLHFDLAAKSWVRRAAWVVFWVALLLPCARFFRQYASGRIPGLGADPVKPLLVTISPQPAENHLRIAVAPPLDRRFPGESAPLRLLFENDGDTAGRFTPMELPAGGCIRLQTSFMQAGGALVPGTMSQGIITTGKDGQPGIDIVSHGTASVAIPLDTACRGEHLPHSEPLELAYNWSTAPGHARKSDHRGPDSAAQPAKSFSGILSTAPVTVTSRRAEFNRRALAAADALAKDFTWPVLLALLGFLTQSVLARRGDRQQVFNTLLPAFTELVQTHYLPIARRMQIVGIEAREIDSTDTAVALQIAVQRTFCAILLMRRRVLHLLNGKGGVFFRSAIAEELFFDCFSTFYREFQHATGDRGQCEACAISLDPTSTLQDAVELLFSFQHAGVTGRLLKGFSTWAAETTGDKTAAFVSYLKLLELGLAVLSFECDRIYYQTDQSGVHGGSNWYFDPPRLEFAGDVTMLPVALQAHVSTIFTKYLNGIPRRCKEGVIYPK